MLTCENVRWLDFIASQIPDEVQAHNDWVNMLGVVPVIRALREKQ